MQVVQSKKMMMILPETKVKCDAYIPKVCCVPTYYCIV